VEEPIPNAPVVPFAVS